MQPTAEHFINIHSHRKPQLANEFVIRNYMMYGIGINIQTLPYLICAGLHPWHLSKYKEREAVNFLTDIVTESKVWAVGEIGLDRAINSPISLQLSYFNAQLMIARAVKKPVIIHAVRTYNDFIPIIKKVRVPFIFHGFNGNLQLAKELLKHGAFLSVGKHIFNEAWQDVFAQIPLEQLFLETDRYSDVTIENIYQRAALLKDISVDELKLKLFCNFANLSTI